MAQLIAFLLPIHRQLATMGLFYLFVCGLWGLVMTWRKMPMDANYRGILAIGYVLGVVLSAAGLTMVISGAQPRDPLHMLYGLLAVVCIPFAGTFKVSNERKPLLYALTSFFVVGVIIRGIITATS